MIGVSIVVPIVVMVPIPLMVMPDLAVIAIPVALIVLLAVMTGFHPARANVCWTGVISIVPLIVAAHRVPVAGDPSVVGAGTLRLNPHDTHRWRRADSYSYRKLSEGSSRRQQR